MRPIGASESLSNVLQFHQLKKHREMIKPLLDMGGMAIAPYDGIAEFHAKNYASFERFLMDAFNDPANTADHQHFVDSSVPLQVMAGYDNLIFGGAVKTSGGVNGILPLDERLRGQKQG